MAKFRWTKDDGANWTVVEASLPYNISGVIASDTVIVEPIGDAVTEQPTAASTTLQTLATDVGTTPTTTRITLGAGQTGVRIFADLTSAAEPFFYLYSSKNGAAARKIKIYPWSARILAGAAGDVFAFATADGRSLAMAPMTHPDALETSFPETGTANADRGTPPYWSPSAGHIVLPTDGAAFQVASAQLVFIREYDPASQTWTPPRWVRGISGRNTSVRCTYKTVAIATRDGSTVAIAAPTGTSIGGTSAAMVNPYLPVTGATRNVATVAELKTAIASAVAGDEIVLASGTYALDVEIGNTSFAANHGVGGRTGMGGIYIRGATGVAADVVLTTDGSGTHGNWDVGCDAASFAGMSGLTFNFGTSDISAKFSNGKLAIQDVSVVGGNPTADYSIGFFNASAPVIVEALRLAVSGGVEDNIGGSGTAGNNAASRIRFVDCVSSNAGAATSAQCLTTHAGLPVEWYGGTLSDAVLNVAAPDSLLTPLYLFFATTGRGARRGGLSNCIVFGCDVDGDRSSSFGGDGGCRFSHVIIGGLTSTQGAFSNFAQTAEHNYIQSTSGAGRGIFYFNTSGNLTRVTNNIIDGFGNGFISEFSAGAGGSAATYGNTFINCPVALRIADANLLVTAKNNATKNSTTGVTVASAAIMSQTTADYNTIDPAKGMYYTPGAHDIVDADAALDAYYFPSASGNCDGNGYTSIGDYIGDSDPWGYVRIYKSDRVSRGARERPAMYSEADLHPDLF